MRILKVSQQFGLNVRRLTNINPLTRVREAVDARCRRSILADRDRCERTVSVVFKRHFASTDAIGARGECYASDHTA